MSLLFHELELHQNHQVCDHRAYNLKLTFMGFSFDFNYKRVSRAPLLGDPC